MKKQINIESQTIQFTFDGLDPVVFHIEKCSDACLEYAQYHGFQARIGDNAAIARKDKAGNIVTVTEAMRRDAVLELVNHYESGTADWAIKGTRAAPQNPVFLDIAARRGCTYEEAMAWYQERMVAEMQAIIDKEQAAA